MTIIGAVFVRLARGIPLHIRIRTISSVGGHRQAFFYQCGFQP